MKWQRNKAEVSMIANNCQKSFKMQQPGRFFIQINHINFTRNLTNDEKKRSFSTTNCLLPSQNPVLPLTSGKYRVE